MSKKVPKIRFSGFDDEWEEYKLGSISKISKGVQRGKQEISAVSTEKDKYPVYNGGKSLSGYTDEYNREDEIMVSEGGASAGYVSYYNGKYWSGGHNFTIDNLSNNKQFILYVLQNVQEKLYKLQVGTGLPNIQLGSINNFDISITSIEEQEKIGKLFKAIDKLISLRERRLDLLKEQKRGFLQKLFPKAGEVVPELRFSGFTEDWVMRKLGDIASFSKGNGYTKNDLVKSGDPIILYGRLYTKYETVIYEVDTFVNKKDKSIISEGNEVLVPASGETSEDISRASVVGKSGLVLGGDLNIIKPENHIDSIFLALTISNGSQQKEMSKRAQGKSVVHLHNSDLQQVNLLYPTINEQKKIGAFFNELENSISKKQEDLYLLKEQKKGLLQNMFI